MPPQKESYLVLVNPVSGGGRGAALAQSLAGVFEKYGASAEVASLPAPGSVHREIKARVKRHGVIVAVGGDGTVSEVAAAVYDMGLDRAIGLIPLGLSNCLARHFNLPLKPEEAVKVIVEGRRQKVGLVEIDNRVALSFVGAGFDAAIVNRVAADRTGTVSDRDYARAGLKAFLDPKWPLIQVEVDGRKIAGDFFQAILCSISNYAHYINVRSEPGFRVYLFSGRKRINLLRSFLRLGIKFDLTKAADLSLPVKEKVVCSSKNGPGFYQFDGEYGGPLPVDCYVQTRALDFLIPV